MYKDLVFLSFLNVVENTDFVPEELLEFLNAIENRVMGYRDVIHLNDQRGMCCLLGDMNAISRVDSYFTNMKMFWEKEEPKELVYSVGLFEVMTKREADEFAYVKTANYSYGYQCICFTFSEILGMFAVGLDNGYIHCYKIENNRLNKLSEEFSLKAHNKRVMSIAFDSLKGVLFSISEDGYLQAIDPVRKQILGCRLKSFLGEQVEVMRDVL